MKLLVYAFQPFGRNKQNISQLVLRNLHGYKNVSKVILPVEFTQSFLINAVQDVKPDAILGLGQYPRGKKIRIERKARNEKKTEGQSLSTITKNGHSTANINMRLKPDNDSWLSYNAGRYVCNYSIYVLRTDANTKNIPIAFLHIPKNLDVAKATRFVEKKINEILKLQT